MSNSQNGGIGKNGKFDIDKIGETAHFIAMVTHINLKNFPFSLIQRLRSVEASTGLRIDYLMQAALIQGLRESTVQECGRVMLPPMPATPSVSPAPAASLMPSAPCPVIVAGEDPDLNLR
ncbi:MAG: hypothetical protein ACLVGY_11125 [Akkermansia muciniphila]